MLRTILLFVALASTQLSIAETRLLRFPDVHNDKVTFVYAGDIYIADVTGGEAKRLTSHSGMELYPKFSADGSQIAFSGEYNGTRQVYVMPSQGGQPTQLTWYNDVGNMPPRGGTDYRVLDWTSDSQNILVRANRLPWGVRMGKYFHVPATGGMPVALEIPEGGGGMYAPDNQKIVYTPIDREFRTWKRYRGGRAQDVWIYDLKNSTSERLTTNSATDHQPLWVGDDIYFVSDRTYTLNLYRWSDQGAVPVTDHEDFDVLWPSAGPNSIVYESGGWIYRFDPKTGSHQKLDITISGDLPGRMPRYVQANEHVQSASIAPDGKAAVFAARGEIFSVPAENGVTKRLTHSADAREIHVNWSPDGEKLVYLSDDSGEYQIYIHTWATGETRQLTDDLNTWIFAPIWSPDSEKLAFSDKTQTLWVLDVDSGRTTKVDHSSQNDITDFTWAPDSSHLAYVKNNSASFASIWIYDMEAGESWQATSSDSNDFSPAFDPEGRYLYFLSNRDFNLDFSALEFDYQYENATRVYAIQLHSDAPTIHGYKSGWNETDADDNSSEDQETDFRIDQEGFQNRIVALQERGGQYGQVQATPGGVLFTQQTNGNGNQLQYFDLTSEKESTVVTNIAGYAVSASGDKLLVRSNGQWAIVSVAADQNINENSLNMAQMEIRLDPVQEWQQMYTDAWRILRDWFYDPNMHGMDWPAIRAKYAPLVDHIAHRGDLDYILGEIAGEMNAGHIYVQNGDMPSVERHSGGLLGAEIVAENGSFRIAKIFAGEPWHNDFRSPLAEPGVDVNVGQYIVAVDDQPASSVQNFYTLLENKGGELVRLKINDKPKLDGATEVLVKTITQETSLRYLNWVESRRVMVDRLSDGKIGYLHLPNTAVDGNRELFKRYLPQVNKEAIIIDARYNGGGFIPDRMIEMVSRKPLNYWKRRGLDPQSTPVFSHDGPKTVLINGYSSSGGDAFPYYFRKLGLGPLIGTRTWGGLIGISGNPMLVDGGGVLASTFRFMDTDGEWAVENEGVSPDIEVIDRPELVAQGQDPTLERAVEEMLDAIRDNPKEKVVAPPSPTEF